MNVIPKSKSDPEISLEEIANKYGNLVSSVCRRMIQNEEIAKEAAQEVWLNIIKGFPSFNGQSKISTWIFTITRRVAMNYSKKEKKYSMKFMRDYLHGGVLEPPDKTDIVKTIWIKEMCDKCLTGILHCLDNESRIAFIFRSIAHLSYEDISGILEKEISAVRKMVSRSRRKLQHFLRNECILYNPDGNCSCRMKKWAEKINPVDEYRKLGTTLHQVNFFKTSESVLPKKNYWENIK